MSGAYIINTSDPIVDIVGTLWDSTIRLLKGKYHFQIHQYYTYNGFNASVHVRLSTTLGNTFKIHSTLWKPVFDEIDVSFVAGVNNHNFPEGNVVQSGAGLTEGGTIVEGIIDFDFDCEVTLHSAASDDSVNGRLSFAKFVAISLFGI